MVKSLNLGILAHVDAGKTSLTERLLHAAGVIDEIGSVDAGSTQTDSLELERRRGITIKSAVVSFPLADVTVNLIDTPGHPDFIAEVERVLNVLDGAVLVISAVEGVQAQTRVLMRALHRLRIPTLIFVNKIDRRGAQDERVLRSIRDRLAPAAVALGSVTGLGARDARYLPFAAAGDDLVSVLAEHDDALLAAYVDGTQALCPGRLSGRARRAVTAGAGAPDVLRLGDHRGGGRGVDRRDQGAAARRRRATPAGRPRAPSSRSSAARPGRRSPTSGCSPARSGCGTGCRSRGVAGKVTAIRVFDRGAAVPAVLGRGGADRQALGARRRPDRRRARACRAPISGPAERRHFAPPTLETVVVPARPADKGALHVALTQLAEQDPLIDLRQDDIRQEMSVSLYGEVQKEVIQATLAERVRARRHLP